jgi:hypothetical protein
VIEHDVPECLQREGTRVVLAGFGLWQIDHPVGQVGSPCGCIPAGPPRAAVENPGAPPSLYHMPGDGSVFVAGGREQVSRRHLDLAEVVVSMAHAFAEFGAGPTGLLRRGRWLQSGCANTGRVVQKRHTRCPSTEPAAVRRQLDPVVGVGLVDDAGAGSPS